MSGAGNRARGYLAALPWVRSAPVAGARNPEPTVEIVA